MKELGFFRLSWGSFKIMIIDLHLRSLCCILSRNTENQEFIVYIAGQKYWLFEGNVALRGFPQPISDFGFEEDVKKIDAVFVWKYNMKTYFVAGNK